MVTLLLITLVTPIVVLAASIADNAQEIGELVGSLAGVRHLPPPAWLTGLPAVGPAIDTVWREASQNLGVVFEQLQSYLAQATGWLLARGAGLGLAVLEFLVATVITGIL
jgi:predicted PurR-regulated permease PerM